MRGHLLAFMDTSIKNLLYTHTFSTVSVCMKQIWCPGLQELFISSVHVHSGATAFHVADLVPAMQVAIYACIWIMRF